MKATLLFLIVFISGISFAQDTLNLPLQIGNYWEYSAMFEKVSLKITSDTSINGKHYFYMEKSNITNHYKYDVGFFRTDSGKLFKYFPALQCSEKEYLYLDFNRKDREIWGVCDLGLRGLDSSYVTYNYTFNKNISIKGYDMAIIENGDTLWGQNVIDASSPEYFSPGLGLIYWTEAFTGTLYLTGAILNGVKYGTITDIHSEDGKANLEYSLSGNYPNPFNPSTEMSYSIKKSGFVTLKVFDVLGKEVTKLVNEFKNTGTYKVAFNAKEIPSGVYFYSLEVNGFTKVKKMVLIK